MYGLSTIDTACAVLGSEHPVSNALRALRGGIDTLSLRPQDILWNAVRGNARTWDDVMNLVRRSDTPSRIFVRQLPGDPALVIPANAVPGDRYDLRWSSFVSAVFGDPTANAIQGAAGARLKNVGASAGSLALVGGEDAFLENDPLSAGSPPIYVFDLGSFLSGNGPNGSAPIVVPDNGFAVLALNEGGAQSQNALASILRLGTNATALVIVPTGLADIDPTLLAGGPTALAVLQHAGQLRFPLPAMPLFTGMLLNAPMGETGGAGPTLFRPIPFNGPVAVGCRYWDTDLATPQNVYWTGTTWVDYANVPT